MDIIISDPTLNRLHRANHVPPKIVYTDYTSDEHVLAMLRRKEEVRDELVKFAD